MLNKASKMTREKLLFGHFTAELINGSHFYLWPTWPSVNWPMTHVTH